MEYSGDRSAEGGGVFRPEILLLYLHLLLAWLIFVPPPPPPARKPSLYTCPCSIIFRISFPRTSCSGSYKYYVGTKTCLPNSVPKIVIHCPRAPSLLNAINWKFSWLKLTLCPLPASMSRVCPLASPTHSASVRNFTHRMWNLSMVFNANISHLAAPYLYYRH